MNKYTFKHEFSLGNDLVVDTVEVTVNTDSIRSLIESFESFLLAVGFHSDTVKEHLGDEDNS